MSSLKGSYDRQIIDAHTHFSQQMSDTGDDLGAFNLAVDGSVTPQEFYIQPLPTQVLFVKAISVILADPGTPSRNDYGAVAGPLANGTIFFIERNGVPVDITLPIKSNIDYVRLSRTFDILSFSGSRVINYRELLSEVSNGIFLDGSKNEKIGIRIQDNLSTVLDHRCQVKGFTKAKVV